MWGGMLRQNFYLDSGASSFGKVKGSSSLLVMAVKLLCINDAKCRNLWLPKILRIKEGLAVRIFTSPILVPSGHHGRSGRKFVRGRRWGEGCELFSEHNHCDQEFTPVVPALGPYRTGLVNSQS